MKKVYKTPYIAIESFQLDAAIAGNCADKGYTTLNHGDYDCGIEPNNQKELIDAEKYFYWANQCEHDVIDSNGDMYDALCYHAMSGIGGYSGFLES